MPRVLVISNNCLSLRNSNGRTLFNLLSYLPNENLTNFYVRDEVSDLHTLSNFYRVTDRQALQSWKTRKPADGKIVIDNTKNNEVSKDAKDSKNPLFSLLRDIVWNSGAWRSPSFQNWLDAFNPEIIILQAGDASFLFRLARRIALKRGIPLIIYNTEDYCFKKYNYMSHRFGVFYPLFRSTLYRQVRKAITTASSCIYNSELLKSEYEHHFDHNAEVIMMAASEEVKVQKSNVSNNPLRCTYLGNLGVGRHTSLIEIANVLQSKNLCLDVYGPASEDVISELINAPGVNYHGVVDYQEVQKIIHESDLLIHAESFGDYAIKDLRFAFSTKIADSLASGVPFFLFAPKELACTTYLSPLVPDFVATNKDEMINKLNRFLDGKSVYPWHDKILPIVKKNHSLKENQQRLSAIITEALHKEVKI